MRKDAAIELMGGVAVVCRAFGISRQAVYQWPDELPPRLTNEVLGAALRLGLRERGPVDGKYHREVFGD